MGQKKTTKTTYNDTKTSAPPSWTMPGIQQASDQVIAALGQMPGEKYTGDFVARPDQALMDQLMAGYKGLNQQAQQSSQAMNNAAMALPAQVRDAMGTNPFANLSMPQAPILPDFAPVERAPIVSTGPAAQAQIVNANPFTGIDRSNVGPYNLPGMDSFKAAEILNAPDLASILPKLPTAPGAAVWDPKAWQGADEGGRLNAALQAAIQPVMRQLTEQVLPGIRSSAIDAGAYTGDRAMQILPGQAIAEAASRGNEITQGLAYQGFQQEADRGLQAWQAFEQMLGQDAQQDNAFNSDIYGKTAQALMQQFGIQADATMQGYQTQQQALLQNAGMQNDYGLSLGRMGLDRYGMDLSAATQEAGMANNYNMDLANLLQSAYNNNASMANNFNLDTANRQQTAYTNNAQMENDFNLNSTTQNQNAMLDLFGQQSSNTLNQATGSANWQNAFTQQLLNAAGMQSGMLNDSLAMGAGGQDMLSQAMQLLMGQQQSGIQNDLAKIDYNNRYPFTGLDIAVPMLAALSGNYGTQTANGSSKQVETTGGLGSVVQGIAGLAMGAAGLAGAGGPLAGLMGGAVPAASSVFQMNKGPSFLSNMG